MRITQQVASLFSRILTAYCTHRTSHMHILAKHEEFLPKVHWFLSVIRTQPVRVGDEAFQFKFHFTQILFFFLQDEEKVQSLKQLFGIKLQRRPRNIRHRTQPGSVFSIMYAHTHTHSHIHTHKHTHTHTCARTHTQFKYLVLPHTPGPHARTHTYTHTHVDVQMRVRTHALQTLGPPTHSPGPHTHIHTHTRTHTHTSRAFLRNGAAAPFTPLLSHCEDGAATSLHLSGAIYQRLFFLHQFPLVHAAQP